ncbi:hypothetical protein KDN32_17795 [Nocardioides sp. J2M5]|uniref:hypothetical protein n=1 Tax=Nocardioides palaemonis TaxID=2829810 RepID=UPI001BA6404D|nr:hypothetical protein [Nocardioides palaemonis]MBS2939596.1 hypothetical protein [Nocardioides palaemonis]
MERLHLGDQVAAILRDAPAPMSIVDLGHLLAFTFVEGCQSGYYGCCESELGRDRMDSMGAIHYECLGDGLDLWTRRPGCATETVRSELDRMLRAGIVTRSKPGRLVLWEWAGESVDMTAFERTLGCA